MPSIQIFDPALCCSTGVCGVEVDQQLVSFAADADWAKQNGAHIERFNLAQQPMDFAQNTIVKGFLERSGQDSLPLIERINCQNASEESAGALPAVPKRKCFTTI